MTTSNEQQTPVRCNCGKLCKNLKGLKIHQGKMKCMKVVEQPHRTGSPDKTQEEPSQESTHSARSLQETRTQPNTNTCTSVAPRIKWPPASSKHDWTKFDDELDMVLETVNSRTVEKKLQAMTTIVVAMGQERFGTVEKLKKQQPYKENRRAREVKQIRQELKVLTKNYKQAKDAEKPGLAELRQVLRKRLMTLKRAEYHRKRRKERAHKRAAFISNPYGFTKDLLGQKRSGSLKCSKEELEEHLSSTYSDPKCDKQLEEFARLIEPHEATREFDLSEIKLGEVQDVVKKARSASTPGPSGVSYRVYKNCPKLVRRLWKLLRVLWRKGEVANQWKKADGVMIPKEENASDLSQFRTISLLSVEGKIFFSIVANRLSSYLLANSFIDTTVQKGGIPGVPGCVEHIGVVTQLVREARESKGDLVVLWLDLKNAYGSIPHQLVELTLQKYQVPEKLLQLIKGYYSNFQLRFTTNDFVTEWHKLEVGIITGCTISVILFATAMNLLCKSAEAECRGPVTVSGIRQPPIRAFMDDLTVTTKAVTGARWLLTGLQDIISWARMEFKPTKSRSLVIKTSS